MSTLYTNRVVLADSEGILTSFGNGDVQSVDFSVDNNSSIVHGMNMEARVAGGYILPNVEIQFSMTAFVRVGQAFIDLLNNWDYSKTISVVAYAASPANNNTLILNNYITFNGAMPNRESFTAPNQGTESTTVYNFLAISQVPG